MTVITYLSKEKNKIDLPKEILKGKRNLSENEVSRLIELRNSSEDWSNVYVSEKDGEFNPEYIRDTRFEGFVVLGRICPAKLKYHDLELETGIINCLVRNSVIGNDCVVRNVSYLENYRLGDRVLLFNIQELSCTQHSKFGNGILKEGEPEENRIWIGVGNENNGRSVLPFESMIASDAYLWSKYRGDSELMNRFVEITENSFSKAKDTFGIIENDVVIKNTTLLKDVKICSCTYIKGAFKIKNVTILSSEDEPSQVGEGVELVNGIVGYGSHIFYQAVAIRFILGRNCQLKYGARLINSVLGDNSTVSCCELLNNLIFPFHEQHHNSSFLIATTVMGQSNIAAGATIGSNHNSRSPDGEIIAGRGFWPGLCTDFKHNSRFASFVLSSKGSYKRELDIQYPFSLISAGDDIESPIHILPAWWFMYNMFAIIRNKYKFSKRDKRAVKVQIIENDPFAPDTMEEIGKAIRRIIELTAGQLSQLDVSRTENISSQEELFQAAKDYLHTTSNDKFTLFDLQAQKKVGAIIYKPLKAYKAYRQVCKYFAVRTLIDFCRRNSLAALEEIIVSEIKLLPLYIDWMNVGGQVMPKEKVQELCSLIKEGNVKDWDSVHAFYADVQKDYEDYKSRYAIYLLEKLYSRSIEKFDSEIFEDILEDVSKMAETMLKFSIESREKDFTDYYRCMTYESKEEMTAVLGTLEDNDFLKVLSKDTAAFKKDLANLFRGLVKKN